MKIDKAEIKKINKAISDAKNREHLHETKEQRIERKAKEYVKKYNAENNNKVENGVKETHRKSHFTIKKPYDFQIKDIKKIKDAKEETFILIDGDKIAVMNGKKLYEKREIFYWEEMPKIEERIIIEFSKIKMKIEVEKMNNFDAIPEEIEMDGEKMKRKELLKAILETGTNLYSFKKEI